ncbi:ABC transporter substrate-binding protein [Halomonas sp. M4R1S46]|uniref:ABC transporter substrate-binding protein n=1 Tax=Halomonas sp. M4R1S46 TaxID=2982692 RepID=UPI0021E4EF36|nr:ABC transporter substrate-binding protein [Halomonas sp. M4R1S46]UYG07110.1 ABC transporter substrate-binding protein [Halomonas sp. M4R1S46]
MLPRLLAATLTAGLIAGLSSQTTLADDRLDIVAPWEINSADPSRAGHVFLRMQVAETLVDTDREGRLVPGLAQRWEPSPEGHRWRFVLREGVRFHDGSPLSAQSVVAALERAAARPGMLSQAPIEAIEADGQAVVLRLSRPYALLPALLAHSSTQILAPAAFDDDGDAVAVIGTGPYAVTALQTPQRLTVERFDDYWGEPASIEAASYLAAPRGETRALMAQSGDADVVFTLDPASRLRLARQPNLTLATTPLPRTVTVKLNAAHPALADTSTRRALSLAVNRQGIARGVMRTPEAAANQLFPPALADWHRREPATPARDLDAARTLLDDQGWTLGDDGIRTRDGRRLALTLTTFADRPELPIIATALQDQWRELGVDVSVNVGNASEIPAGHHDGSLEMGLMARNYGLVPDPLATLREDFGPEGGDWGAMNWSDPQLTALLESLTETPPGEARRDQAHAVAELLDAALPVIPVAWYQQTAAVNDRLDGFSLDPLERSYRLTDLSWSET